MQINILFVHRGCHVSRLLFPPKQESLTPAGLFWFYCTKGFRSSKQREKGREPARNSVSFSDVFRLHMFISQFVALNQ